jgi:hypothetical protein
LQLFIAITKLTVRIVNKIIRFISFHFKISKFKHPACRQAGKFQIISNTQ